MTGAPAFVDAELGVPDAVAQAARHAAALERLAGRPGVAVVVPIFNAADELQACLDALLATAADAQVLLVDDRSTDPRVAQACRGFCDRHEGARVVVNPQNVGFVASVNAGVRAADADRDVVLLNSDTVPTDGWLAKLARAAYSGDDVAAASPLSNAAGIFSVPLAHERNPLPEGWTAEDANRLVEHVAVRAYERMPTASGFCLYLRRDALDEVGLLDDRLFHRGYGEETDLCARAGEAGLTAVLDDATFVFHEREASFGAGKAKLKRRNARVLKALHPGYLDAQRRWEERTALPRIRERYAQALEALGGAPPPERVTTLAVAGEGEGPAPADGKATLVLGAATAVHLPGGGRIDLGAAGAEHPAGTVAWCLNRLGAEVLRVDGEALPAQDAALVARALAVREAARG